MNKQAQAQQYFHLSPQTSNAKLGFGMAASTSSKNSCPSTCPHKNTSCYARFGPLQIHWSKVSSGERGSNWDDFCDQVNALPKGHKIRIFQAGDMPSSRKNIIDRKKLRKLSIITKNKKLQAFGYTHYPLNKTNVETLKQVIDNGLVVNASTDSLKAADIAKELGLPVAVVVPSDSPEVLFTPKGNKVVICPQQSRENITCSSCMLCHNKNRSVIIGFRAHGNASKSLDKNLKSQCQ